MFQPRWWTDSAGCFLQRSLFWDTLSLIELYEDKFWEIPPLKGGGPISQRHITDMTPFSINSASHFSFSVAPPDADKCRGSRRQGHEGGGDIRKWGRQKQTFGQGSAT